MTTNYYFDPTYKIQTNYKVRVVPVCLPPVLGEPEYREAICLDAIPRKEPEWDVARQGPAVFASRRELELAKEYLERHRDIAVKESIELRVEWEDLVAKENALKKSFLKFNKFVLENKDKNERAQKNKKQEALAQVSLIHDVDDLKATISYMTYVRDLLREKLDQYSMFEKYLEAVVIMSGNIPSVQECLKRYEALSNAREEISNQETRGMICLERLLAQIEKLAEDRNTKIIALNTELSEMDRRFVKAKILTLYWETAIVGIKNMVSDKTQTIYLVERMAWDLYKSLAVRSGKIVTLEMGDLENHLKFINLSIIELRHVIEKTIELSRKKDIKMIKK